MGCIAKTVREFSPINTIFIELEFRRANGRSLHNSLLPVISVSWDETEHADA